MSAVPSIAKLHPLMRVAFDAARSAEKAGVSTWDALAMFAGTEERRALSEKGLTRAVQAQIEAYGSTLEEPDWSPNTNSTWRVYRKLIVTARKYAVPVTVDDGGESHARSVGDVRADVKAAKEAEKAASGEGEGEGSGDDVGKVFDALPPDERIVAACGFIEKAFGELPTIEARDLARQVVRDLLARIS